MREAIGGTWLMTIVLIFVVLFSGFLAFGVNYSKAFKVKNEIIDIIEENEGIEENNGMIKDVVSNQIETYLSNIGYGTTDNNSICERYDSTGISDGGKSIVKENNYCVVRMTSDQNRPYYRVTTFVIIELPFFSGAFTIPVSGETKRIYAKDVT